MTMHLLLIENNRLDQSKSLLSYLENQDYEVVVVHTPKVAAEKTGALWPNLIVFNSTKSRSKLPGFQKAINKLNLNIPFVVVGDQDHLSSTANTDTIFVAPDNPQQLCSEIKKATAKQKDRFIRLPDLTIDCQQRQLLHHKKRYHLTPKGFKLLHLLIDHQNQDLSRKAIMKNVWETDYMGDTRTLDVHIRWLREKIEDNPSRPRRLLTIRGIGYRFITHPD
jgi:DNA-binding response OmpR family regulator